ncbi:MAG TPA: ketoacyl-ACP synthase III [Anaerolineaceae bacterium]|nr:ketoacyl-ACP synthase III [Anaerolineaceae bacterium]
MTRSASIIATGRYVPEFEHTNAMFKEQLAKINPQLVDVVDKFEASSNIKMRRHAPKGWVTSDLAVAAGKDALNEAGLKPEDLDMILVGTDSPDYITPATSVVVQHKLGAVNAGTFDIGCACASFPTGLIQAAGMLATNSQMKYIMVIGSYMMRLLSNWESDVMSFFYGDGAGAAILAVDSKPGYLGSSLFADGSYHAHWGIYSGGTFEPVTAESFDAGRTKVKLVTPFPAEVNNDGWPARMYELAKNSNFDIADIDMAIFTQVRYASIELVMNKLGLPMERTHWVMDKWGYTGSACLPMAFDDARKLGKVKSGDLVTFVGSGVGYNQAAAAFIMP